MQFMNSTYMQESTEAKEDIAPPGTEAMASCELSSRW